MRGALEKRLGPTFLSAPLRRLDEAARARSPWYRDGAFSNFDEPDGLCETGGLRRFLRWKLGQPVAPIVPDAPDLPIEVRPLAPEALDRPARGLRVAWLGHASLAVATPRLRIAIDPVFWAPPFLSRLAPLPIAPDALLPFDLVLLSHNHYDHLDVPSLAALLARNPDARALVPPGLEGLVRAIGFREARSLEWFEEAALEGGARVMALPARHWSKRGLSDDRQSHWCGFLIEADGRRLWIAGDTAWGGHFEAIAERAPRPDAAVVPIGAYAPRWFMRPVHMDPSEALEAAATVNAAVVLPCHYGTFRLGDDALGEPPILLARALEARRAPPAVRAWRPGEVHEV